MRKLKAIETLEKAGFERTGLGFTHPRGYYCEVREDGMVIFPSRGAANEERPSMTPPFSALAVRSAVRFNF